MTISGGRTEQLDIFCHITDFTSDFLSFIVVDLFSSFTEPFNCVSGIGDSEITSVYSVSFMVTHTRTSASIRNANTPALGQ